MSENDEDNLEGFGTVEFMKESLCQSFFIKKVTGYFKDGKLDGEAIVEYLDGSFMKANFKSGVMHGLVRKFWCKFGACDTFESEAWSQPRHLQEVSF